MKAKFNFAVWAVLLMAVPITAQDKPADPCADLRLINAQLKLQVAQLKDQLLQAQYQLVQNEKQQAEADLRDEQDKQAKAKTAQVTPPKPVVAQAVPKK